MAVLEMRVDLVVGVEGSVEGLVDLVVVVVVVEAAATTEVRPDVSFQNFGDNYSYLWLCRV